MPRVDDPGCDVRNLVVVLGDQLSRGASAWDGFDPAADLVWMAEVSEEIASSEARSVLDQIRSGRPV